jgi:hypothetical protein
VLKFLSVNFNGIADAPSRVSSFRLVQEKYKHEIAYLTFNEWEVLFDLVKPGIPVDVLYQESKSERTFYGYVHHIEPVKTPGSNHIIVVLIGASYVFKQASQRIYKNMTASAVVKEIAERNEFSYSIVDHPRVYPQIAQAGITDWLLMVRLAKQCGYSLRTENTSIYFEPLTEDFTTYKSQANIFEMRNANDPEGSTLYSFNPIIGETLHWEDTGSKSATAVSGIDLTGASTNFAVSRQKRDVTIRQNRAEEFFDRFETQIVALDYESASYESEAIDVLTMFPYRATAQVLGHAELRPGMPVYLSGIGESYEGYWIILEAEHIIENLRYTTNLAVGLDSLGRGNRWTDGTTLLTLPKPEVRNIVIGQSKDKLKGLTRLSVTNLGKLSSSPRAISTTKNRKPLTNEETTIVKWVAGGNRDLRLTESNSARSAAASERLSALGVL